MPHGALPAAVMPVTGSQRVSRLYRCLNDGTYPNDIGEVLDARDILVSASKVVVSRLSGRWHQDER